MLTMIERYEKDLALYLQMLKNREERYINLHGASVMLELSENEIKLLCNEEIIKHKVNDDQYYIKIKHINNFISDIILIKEKYQAINKILRKING